MHPIEFSPIKGEDELEFIMCIVSSVAFVTCDQASLSFFAPAAKIKGRLIAGYGIRAL